MITLIREQEDGNLVRLSRQGSIGECWRRRNLLKTVLRRVLGLFHTIRFFNRNEICAIYVFVNIYSFIQNYWYYSPIIIIGNSKLIFVNSEIFYKVFLNLNEFCRNSCTRRVMTRRSDDRKQRMRYWRNMKDSIYLQQFQ